jgi:hypothetical protein
VQKSEHTLLIKYGTKNLFSVRHIIRFVFYINFDSSTYHVCTNVNTTMKHFADKSAFHQAPPSALVTFPVLGHDKIAPIRCEKQIDINDINNSLQQNIHTRTRSCQINDKVFSVSALVPRNPSYRSRFSFL